MISPVIHGESRGKVRFLLDADIHTWDLTPLNPNRVKWLAQLGWKATVPQLQRMDPLRRYPMLIAFLAQALAHHMDVAVELYDQCLWEYYSAARQELKEWRQATARSANDKLRILRELGQVLLTRRSPMWRCAPRVLRGCPHPCYGSRWMKPST
jgi:hypothetical protein